MIRQKQATRHTLETSPILFPDLADWPNEGDQETFNNYEDLQMCLTRLGSLAVAAVTSTSSEKNNSNHSAHSSQRPCLVNGNEITSSYLDKTYQELYGRNLNFLQNLIGDSPKIEEREKFTTRVMINVLMDESNDANSKSVSDGCSIVSNS